MGCPRFARCAAARPVTAGRSAERHGEAVPAVYGNHGKHEIDDFLLGEMPLHVRINRVVVGAFRNTGHRFVPCERRAVPPRKQWRFASSGKGKTNALPRERRTGTSRAPVSSIKTD